MTRTSVMISGGVMMAATSMMTNRVEEKNNHDRIETFLKLGSGTNVTTETTKESFADTKETILSMMSNNPKITATEIASVCGITENGVAYHIKKLKQSGRITRIGSTRYDGEWKVN